MAAVARDPVETQSSVHPSKVLLGTNPSDKETPNVMDDDSAPTEDLALSLLKRPYWSIAR